MLPCFSHRQCLWNKSRIHLGWTRYLLGIGDLVEARIQCWLLGQKRPSNKPQTKLHKKSLDD